MDGRCKTVVAAEGQNGSGCRGLERALRDAKIVVLALERSCLAEEAEGIRRLVPGLLRYCPKASFDGYLLGRALRTL